jgi:Flp pilus assembly protein TadG
VSTFDFDRLLRNRRGNVAMMYALVAPVLVFGGGAAIDYGRAAQIHTKLNAAADAAALAALTPTMLQQSSQTAHDAAVNMFKGLTENLAGVTANATQVTVSVTAGANNTLIRTVHVNYSTSVNTIFSQVLRVNALPVSGVSQASAEAPPNIDFYVLLDNSPSMALPATAAGIAQMEALTPKQDSGTGCAFACHQANTGYNTSTPTNSQTDTVYNPCVDGTSPTLPTSAITINSVKYTKAWCDASKSHVQLDNYALARKNKITLRLDELNSGVSTLLQTASTTTASSEFATPPQYRFAIYSMDSLWSIGLAQLMARTANYATGWTTASATFGVMEMFQNNDKCANSSCSSGTATSSNNYDALADTATNFDDSLGKLSQTTYIPNPGNGTNQTGDTPQEVLFIVTDGVEDELSGSTRLQQAINDLGSAPYGNSSGTNWCTTIKNRGIKIAILYTDYLAVPTDSWYETHIAPVQTDIGPALQACATPGLFIDEANDTNIGTDLANLFNAATQSGHLTQ